MAARIMIAAALALAGLTGCGGETRPEEAQSLVGEGTVVVAALGDSITAGSPYWDPNRRVRKQIGPELDRTSQWEYWAAREHPELAFRNCGVYGERTDEIAKRLEDCAAGAEVLVVQGGINDVAQGRSPEEAAGDLRSMVRRGQELGLRVALTDVLPWNGGYPRAAEPIDELNQRIAAIAQEAGVLLLPFHDTLVDPDRPGHIRDEWTSDGDHPSVEGYRRLGELAFRLP
jgi:lysophospholipase L1-like esterase